MNDFTVSCKTAIRAVRARRRGLWISWQKPKDDHQLCGHALDGWLKPQCMTMHLFIYEENQATSCWQRNDRVNLSLYNKPTIHYNISHKFKVVCKGTRWWFRSSSLKESLLGWRTNQACTQSQSLELRTIVSLMSPINNCPLSLVVTDRIENWKTRATACQTLSYQREPSCWTNLFCVL